MDVNWLTKPKVPLTGDVYMLNLQDIRDIIESGQISGAIWLSDTYGVNTISFVTIPVSNELTDRLILHRPQESGVGDEVINGSNISHFWNSSIVFTSAFWTADATFFPHRTNDFHRLDQATWHPLRIAQIHFLPSTT